MERHVYGQENINATLSEILEVLRSDLNHVLGPIIGRAQDGDDPLATLHAHFAGADVERQIAIHPGEVEEVNEHTVRVRMAWHATHHDELYPIMSGELEFSTVSESPPITELDFIGHYKPPMGIVGVVGDAIVGHKIAEEAVQGFVVDVAGRLMRQVEEVRANQPA